MKVWRARQGGVLCLQMRNVFLSEVLEGKPGGLLTLDDRWYRIYSSALSDRMLA